MDHSNLLRRRPNHMANPLSQTVFIVLSLSKIRGSDLLVHATRRINVREEALSGEDPFLSNGRKVLTRSYLFVGQDNSQVFIHRLFLLDFPFPRALRGVVINRRRVHARRRLDGRVGSRAKALPNGLAFLLRHPVQRLAVRRNMHQETVVAMMQMHQQLVQCFFVVSGDAPCVQSNDASANRHDENDGAERPAESSGILLLQSQRLVVVEVGQYAVHLLVRRDNAADVE